jgi:hypothetical protein
MLEPHLAEKKHQEESKLWTASPYKASLCHVTLRRQEAPVPSDTSSKPAWETFGIPSGEHQASHSIPPATPGIHQHSPWADWPPPHKKINKNKQIELNNKQETAKEQAAKGTGCSKHTGEGEKGKELLSARTFSKQRLERQKDRQWADDKPLPEVRHSSPQSSSPEPVNNIKSQKTLQNWKTVSKPS